MLMPWAHHAESLEVADVIGASPAKIAGIEIGDHIIVYETDGRIVDMRFVLVEGDVLRGSLFDDGPESVEIKLEHIEKIEAERIAFGRSTAAVLGGIVLAPLAAVGAGLALAEQ